MNPKTYILLVEDSEEDGILMLRQLRKQGLRVDCHRVDSREALRRALLEEWDIVISDYSLPGFTGLDALRMVREKSAEIPFIIVSGVIGERTAVAAMKNGAQDYLLKDNMSRLGAAVRREIREARIRAAKQRAENALRRTAQAVQQQRDALEKKNIALREVLSQIEMEKDAVRKQILGNIETMVLPVLHRIRIRMPDSDVAELDLVEKNLRALTDRFGGDLGAGLSDLTPRQQEICNMIREGLLSKDIADKLGVSLRTVETHRNAIRKKLGIQNEDINLVTHLRKLRKPTT